MYVTDKFARDILYMINKNAVRLGYKHKFVLHCFSLHKAHFQKIMFPRSKRKTFLHEIWIKFRSLRLCNIVKERYIFKKSI